MVEITKTSLSSTTSELASFVALFDKHIPVDNIELSERVEVLDELSSEVCRAALLAIGITPEYARQNPESTIPPSEIGAGIFFIRLTDNREFRTAIDKNDKELARLRSK